MFSLKSPDVFVVEQSCWSIVYLLEGGGDEQTDAGISSIFGPCLHTLLEITEPEIWAREVPMQKVGKDSSACIVIVLVEALMLH